MQACLRSDDVPTAFRVLAMAEESKLKLGTSHHDRLNADLPCTPVTTLLVLAWVRLCGAGPVIFSQLIVALNDRGQFERA